MVAFLSLKVQWLVAAASTSRSALVVQSRHPGRYPKLRSLTLSDPAFEPLTEHHAFSTGLMTAAVASGAYPRGQIDVVSVPYEHDEPVWALSFGRR